MNTQVKINHNEPLYTFTETSEVITWEQCKRQELYRKRRMNFIKQKLCGIALILLSIMIPFLLDGDITVCILTLPLGIWLLFTRLRVMTF